MRKGGLNMPDERIFHYCPACGSERIELRGGKRFSCPACGFIYYHNTAAATALILKTRAGILFLVRGQEPERGKLALPGGFVDPAEGAIEGMRRECREEIGWDPGPGCRFAASYPNSYRYKGVLYNTCDLFFAAEAPGLSIADLRSPSGGSPGGEILGLRFIRPEDLDLKSLAFESARQALRQEFPAFFGP
ncbi:MAG: NUDIX domain-containing protein [Treponema sp.]|jgi:ADP-ribose pyrophosphatase YjhB (NUDIX family)|nr:NUDIX domain-containing protein [Treponema sp.]